MLRWLSVSSHKKFICEIKWNWASYKLPQLWRNNVQQAKEQSDAKNQCHVYILAKNDLRMTPFRITKNIKYLWENLTKCT